jgi:hypothetical protein
MVKMNLKEKIANSKIDIAEITGLPINAVTGSAMNEETGFLTVEMELLERRGIPDTMDMLGIYEVSVDKSGTVLEYVRKGLRKRGDKTITPTEEY